MTVLATALAFARRGHAVLPITWPVERESKLFCSCGSDRRGRPCGRSATKHPYGKLASNGLLSATLEPVIIKHWFGDAAPEANLGVVTDKLVVVDIDPRHGGDESLEALVRQHGELPPTWRVLTGGGGEHILFICPDRVTIGNVAATTLDDPPLGKGIDIRAAGGYVVAPPSRHISGKMYAWSVDHHPQDTPLAPTPDWLITRLTARTQTPSDTIRPIPSDQWSRLTRQPIAEYRDAAAARIVGHLLRRGCDFQLIVGMMHAWNSAWCKPPLGYQELNRIIDRIANKEAARIERELSL
jgi:hypothetical protein